MRPRWVIGPLLVPIAILAAANVQSIGFMSGAVEVGQDLPVWSLWGQIVVFMVWGTTLTAATVSYGRGSRANAHAPGL